MMLGIRKKAIFVPVFVLFIIKELLYVESAAILEELMIDNTASNLVLDGIYATFGR